MKDEETTSPFGDADDSENTLPEGISPPVEEPVAPPPPAAKKKRKPITSSAIGKGVTLANFVIAILFLTIAFFFHANKIQVDSKKQELDKITRELTQLEGQRKQVTDGLEQEIEAEKQRLAALGQQHQKELGDLEAAVKQTKDRIEAARKEQANLNAEAAKHHGEQQELITEIQRLRGVYEDTRSDEEALAADKSLLEDQLAKVQNNLEEAVERSKQIDARLVELEKSPSP
ncbi:hypothetical protein K2Y11_10375 [bacterium]|nr:hypothetical protein [bacterium]